MDRKRENSDYSYIITGVIVALLTFALLFTAFAFVTDGKISTRNIISYILTALSIGVIASVFHYFRLFIALWIFIAGLTVGYADMFRVFLVNDFGWNDIVGLMSFFSYAVIGLFAGLILQIIRFLYKKYKAAKSKKTDIK